jgi:hypothetical protein
MYDAIESFRFRVVADQCDTTTQFFQPHRWCVINRSIKLVAQQGQSR